MWAQYSTRRRGGTAAGAVDEVAVVGAEPREEGEVVAARDDVDAVDLDDLHAVDDALYVAHGRGPRLGSRVGEALSGQRDATCLRERQRPAGHVAEPRRWV